MAVKKKAKAKKRTIKSAKATKVPRRMGMNKTDLIESVGGRVVSGASGAGTSSGGSSVAKFKPGKVPK